MDPEESGRGEWIRTTDPSVPNRDVTSCIEAEIRAQIRRGHTPPTIKPTDSKLPAAFGPYRRSASVEDAAGVGSCSDEQETNVGTSGLLHRGARNDPMPKQLHL